MKNKRSFRKRRNRILASADIVFKIEDTTNMNRRYRKVYRKSFSAFINETKDLCALEKQFSKFFNRK